MKKEEERAEEAVEMELMGHRAIREGDREISLHALQRCPSKKIIKVKGLVGKKKLMVLIDSGGNLSPIYYSC